LPIEINRAHVSGATHAEIEAATSVSHTLESQRISRFQVDRVYETPTGEVHFTDERRGFDSESGWVYSPGHTPGCRDGDLIVENLGGPRCRYHLVMNYWAWRQDPIKGMR